MLCYPLSCIAIYVMHTKTTPDSHLWAKFVLRFAREGAKPFAPNSFTFRHETKKNGNHFIRLDFFFGKMAMHSSDPSISKPISDVESVRTPNECESLKSCSSENSKKKSNILVQSVATARVEFVRVKIVLHHMPLLCN